MPNRLRQNQNARADLVLKSDTDNPIYLGLDRERSKASRGISWRYAPTVPGTTVTIQEWYWQNAIGGGGAGTTVETPKSRAEGAYEYGEFAWGRRQGVLQPAGALTKLTLPPGTAALTSGQLDSAAVYFNVLYITTRNRYVVAVPLYGTGAVLDERDCGAGSTTAGIAVFSGGGTACLYVGCTGQPLQELNGSTWTAGETDTKRGWFATPYWALGPALATGGLAGASGGGDDFLVGTNTAGTGFYHLAGDPKVSANWSALTETGNAGTAYPINRIVESNTVVWFATGTGVFAVNELGHSPNLTKWVEATSSATNGQTVAFWNNLIWYGHESGLIVFSPDGSRIDLGQMMNFGARSGQMPIFGRPQVLAAAPDGMYVAYYNAVTDVGYVGILLVDPDGSYRWSMAEAVLPGEIPTFIREQTDILGNPGLYIGTSNSATGALSLYRQSLPRYGRDPETDAVNGGPFRAATDWSARLSRWNGTRGVQNTLRQFAVEANYVGSAYPDNTVTLQLANDGGAFIDQTIAASDQTGTVSARLTGAPLSGSVRATNSQVKLVVHNDTRHPVVIDSVAITYTERPERTAFKTYPILIQDRGSDGDDPWAVVSRLERTVSEDALICEDEFGRTCEWLVEDLTIVSEEQSPGEPWLLHADLTISETRRVNQYDQGTFYDAGSPYQ